MIVAAESSMSLWGVIAAIVGVGAGPLWVRLANRRNQDADTTAKRATADKVYLDAGTAWYDRLSARVTALEQQSAAQAAEIQTLRDWQHRATDYIRTLRTAIAVLGGNVPPPPPDLDID